ncbi:hypothetical protein OPV22_020345 [Ensete ventricosum]|uniref:Angiotensin-converting enzyme 2 n=1 Tax=Ensete ventricosum TaxID=4639 RepID=A0AAV8QK40_ENSVE|nr:hypothetical protein OPV22_020345 [Ensete ventricosum]
MKTSENPQRTEELQPSSQASNEIQPSHQNPLVAETPGPNSCSSSITSSQNINVSLEDIELVQNLIEHCLQLYMNRGEVVRTLSNRARIEPGFTTLVWKKLEEENPDFFRAYYIRLKLKKQIILFNHLLEHQCQLMKCPVLPNVSLAPIYSGIHAGPGNFFNLRPCQDDNCSKTPEAINAVNSMPLGYPVLQQPEMTTTGHPHFDPGICGLSSCHVVNGIPTPGRYHPIHINSGNDIVINDPKPEATPATTPCGAISSMSEMVASPASMASNNHFPFVPSEISGMGLDASTLETTLTSDVASMEELQLGQDCAIGLSRDSLGSVGPLWNFSITDLAADLANLGDLGALENYASSPFLPSDSDIRLDSSDTIEEYFAEAITAPSSQPHDEKS